MFAHKSPKPFLKVTIQRKNGTACAFTDFIHCIASEILYHNLEEKATKLENTMMDIILAYGSQTSVKVYKTEVYINIEIRPVFLTLQSAKDNRSLLENVLLFKAEIVLDVANQNLPFQGEKFNFGEDIFISECNCREIGYNKYFTS